MFFWLLVFEDAQQSLSSTRWYKIFYPLELNLNWNNMSTTGSLSEILPARLLSRETSSNWNHATVDKTRRSSRWHRHSQPGAGQLQSRALDPLCVTSNHYDWTHRMKLAEPVNFKSWPHWRNLPVAAHHWCVCLSLFFFLRCSGDVVRWDEEEWPRLKWNLWLHQ